jgi:alpha-L-rhamnosidase
VPYQFYKIYGEREMLAETWQPMRRWVSYMVSRCEHDLVTHEEEKGWCLGDWETPEKVCIPEEFVNTCFLVRAIDCMKEIAAVIGEDTEALDAVAERCRNALHKKYYADGQYFGGRQGADAFALWARLYGHERLIEKIRTKYEALGRFDTGIFGTDILVEVLFEEGFGDLAVRLLSSENTEVGFNFMRSRGATTLYESLNDEKQSHNHPMFGACVRHFYSGLLGIRPAEYESGYSRVVISPDLSTCVRRASGSVMTGWGEIRVSFDVDQGFVEACVGGRIEAVLRVRGREYAVKERLKVRF